MDPAFIGSAKALVVSGTHFSTPTTDAACRKAINAARANSTKVVFDSTTCPVLWGLTSKSDGENC